MAQYYFATGRTVALHKSHACHAKAAAERPSPNDAKAYIRPPAAPPSPTPATQKQRQSGGAQTTPKRTSDPLQRRQAPRLPRKSSGRAAEPKRRQSVHQTPLQCHQVPCHAKAAAERRSPNDAKAYIRPSAVPPSPVPRKSSGRAAEPKRRQSVHQTPCRAASPTPATQKQRPSSGDQTTPKRTPDPLQRNKSHACHAKAAAEQRRPNDAKAYIRPPAVKLCDVNLCDVNLCDVNLCDVSLCVVNLCDVNLCDINQCDVNLCDVNLCDVSLCVVNLCDVNLWDFNQCDVNL